MVKQCKDYWVMKMMGDRGILSNNPILEKAGLQVENITVEFNK